MPKRTNQFTLSNFYCTHCGKQVYSLPRQVGAQREPGHLKTLYCIYCRDEYNCVEIRPFGKYTYENFRQEYEGKNFDENGMRKLPYLQFFRQLE